MLRQTTAVANCNTSLRAALRNGRRSLSSMMTPHHSLSYDHGVSASPLRAETIGQTLANSASIYAERTALVVKHQNVRWSYRELQQRVDECAAALLGLGLKPGARVGIWAPNCWEWVVTQFATARVGCVLVCINPAYRSSELAYALNKVGCEALVMSAGVKGNDFVSILHEAAPDLASNTSPIVSSTYVPSLRHILLTGPPLSPRSCPAAYLRSFADVCIGGTPDLRRTAAGVSSLLQCDDVINIQYTSGTTGAPKGAALTHHNIVNNAFFVGEALHLSHEDKLCLPVPLFHCFGMVMGSLNAMIHGAAIILPSESFDPEKVLAAVSEEAATVLYGVPSMFIAELSHPRFPEFSLSTLRTGILAGSPCPLDVMQQVTQKMHMHDVTIAYGMTETSPVSTQSTTRDSLHHRVATVGRAHPHVEVKVVGADGSTLPRGQKGELCVRGYSVMRGYWGDENKTREAIDASRWMHTGDLAVMDDDGFVAIVGRLKDMIIRGGENVYPREIEEFLHRHPDIAEAHAFGVPCPKLGEVVAVWIRLRVCHPGSAPRRIKDADDVVAYCHGKIAHYKIPKFVKFVDAFPMTLSGKVQKYVMREEMTRAVQ